jgi:hypothetical protein
MRGSAERRQLPTLLHRAPGRISDESGSRYRVGAGANEGAGMPPFAVSTGLGIGFVLYVVLLLTLGIISIRKGHWVMFLIGLVFPLFWLIGALLPPRGAD